MALGFYDELGGAGDLPHRPISLPVFLVVEEAMRVAWDLLRRSPRPGFDLLNAKENIVTHEFQEALYDVVFAKGLVDGFNRELFTTITRDSKVRNYDGATLDKMPDLLIGLVGRLDVFKPSQDWLYVECKPVDSAHSLGKHYCGKGVIRFVRGEYAWTMTSALMVGYVREGYAISPQLVDALNAMKEIATLDTPSPCSRSMATPMSEAVHISRHSRTFNYVETGHLAPAITIRHLWLRRD